MASVYPLKQAVQFEGAAADPLRLLDRLRFGEACFGGQ